MIIKSHGITIGFDDEEILHFWNIVMFALDYHNEQEKLGKPCMTPREIALAREIADTLDGVK